MEIRYFSSPGEPFSAHSAAAAVRFADEPETQRNLHARVFYTHRLERETFSLHLLQFIFIPRSRNFISTSVATVDESEIIIEFIGKFHWPVLWYSFVSFLFFNQKTTF